MTLEQFVERVRIGIISGVWTMPQVRERLHENGWFTTKDVPDDRRAEFLKGLEK